MVVYVLVVLSYRIAKSRVAHPHVPNRILDDSWLVDMIVGQKEIWESDVE